MAANPIGQRPHGPMRDPRVRVTPVSGSVRRVRLAVAVATAVALALLALCGAALPAAAADDALPDLGSVVIAPADLPAGFVASEESASSFFEATGALSSLFEASPALADRNGTVLERRAGGQLEFVVMVLAAPVSTTDQARFDREIASGDLAGQLRDRFGTADTTRIEGLGPGEARVAIRIRAEGGAVTEELVVFRRGPVIAFVGHAWTEGTTETTSLRAVAGLLDGRLAAAIGPGPARFREPGPLVPAITTYIPTPLDVSTDPAVVGTNLALAALATLLLTISSKLATRMLAEHETALFGRLPLVGQLQRFEAGLATTIGARLGRRSGDLLRLAGIALFYGLVFSLLDPTWEPLTATGAWLLVSFTVACGIVGIADDLVQWRVARRWSLPAELAIRPTNVLLAIASMGISRAASVVPGLMFGTPEALQLDESALDEARARRLTTAGFVALIAIGTASWATTAATTAAARAGDLPAIVGGAEAFLLLVFAATVQNLFVALLGLSGSAGDLARRWSPVAWGGALLAVTFLFWHTLVNPTGDASAALSSRNVQVTLGLVCAFTIVTVAAWAVLRIALGERPATPVLTDLAAPAPAGMPLPPTPSLPPRAAPAPVSADALPAPGVPMTLREPGFGPPGGTGPGGSGAIDVVLGTSDRRARGRAWLRFAGGWVMARTELIDPRAGRQFGAFALLSGSAVLLPFIGYVLALDGRPASPAVAGGLIVLLLAWAGAVVVARLWLERYRLVHTVAFPVRAVAGIDVGRDWNLGCALAILLTPLVGLLYLFVARRRVIRVLAPFAADRAGVMSLRLKGSRDEGRYLQQLVTEARARA